MHHASLPQPSRRSARRGLFAIAVASAALLAPAGVASAAGLPYTASFDGTTTTITGTTGADDVSVTRDFDGSVRVYHAEAGAGCLRVDPADDESATICGLGSGGIQVNVLGGDDLVNGTVLGAPMPEGAFRVDLGDGADRFRASKIDGPLTVLGGAGKDTIEGSRQNDTLDGGPGNDVVNGHRGSDIVRGGDGDDVVYGDDDGERGADLIDGGPGIDSTDDWSDPESVAAVTLDGVANDGFVDEADNVISVEKLRASAALTFTGDDGVNVVTAGEVATSSAILLGLGGDDELNGTDRADRIDGGAGADLLTGGYGNDTITGGAGPDNISGDRAGRCNEMHCDLSPGSAADIIDAVDGELDAVKCGPGDDTVKADAIDSIDADCEHVQRVGAAAGPVGGSGSPAGGSGVVAGGNPVSLTVSGTKLGSALSKGLKVRVRGLQAGTKLRLKARSGKTIVATGSGKVSAAGNATLTLRFTVKAKRALRGKRKVSLKISGPSIEQVVTLTR